MFCKRMTLLRVSFPSFPTSFVLLPSWAVKHSCGCTVVQTTGYFRSKESILNLLWMFSSLQCYFLCCKMDLKLFLPCENQEQFFFPMSIIRNNRFSNLWWKRVTEIFEFCTSSGLEKLFKILFEAGFSMHGHFIFPHQISIERNICSRWPFHRVLWNSKCWSIKSKKTKWILGQM